MDQERAWLTLYESQGTRTLRLRSPSSLGRAPHCMIRLVDELVAAEHCLIVRRNEGWVVRDLGSPAGTYVNGRRIAVETFLKAGDALRIGQTRLQFEIGAEPRRDAELPRAGADSKATAASDPVGVKLDGSRIVCSRCGKENRDHYMFCLGCGSELPRSRESPRVFFVREPPSAVPAAVLPPASHARVQRSAGTSACPGCGSPVPADFRFCGTCGHRMGSGPSPAAAAASPASIKQRLSSTGSHAPEHRSLESLDDRPCVVGDITGHGVDCSLVFPPAAARAATLLVQVFAHLPDQRAIIEREARRLDGTATRRATRRLRVAISRGDALQVELQARGLEIDERVQELVWTGQPESVQFGVRVPDSHPGGNVIVTAIVSRDGLPLGALKGVLNVGSTANAVEAEEVGIARRFRRAFVSYATKDRDQVLRRVQMLHSLDIDYFQDLLSLSPGERWERELYRQIDRCDLFLLFWSTAAKQSDWVMQEVQYALDRKRGDDDALPEIRPVILEGPPVPTPPAELAHLQFNDLLVYLLRPSEALSDG